MLVALSAGALWISSRRTGVPSPDAAGGIPVRIVASALTFIWLNAVLLRSIHHWADVPYNGDAMMESVLVQSALSVFWTFLALAVMVFATRRALRTPWMVGAGLMAVVVAKLVLVDLSKVSGVERIVSFIGVGVLMLVVGYFSPVPPRTSDLNPPVSTRTSMLTPAVQSTTASASAKVGADATSRATGSPLVVTAT